MTPLSLTFVASQFSYRVFTAHRSELTFLIFVSSQLSHMTHHSGCFLSDANSSVCYSLQLICDLAAMG